MSLKNAIDATVDAASAQSRDSFATLLREPNMRRLWIAQAFSSAGEALATVAMPLLVYQMTESARLVGFIALVLILPRVLLAPITGLLADRVNRRWLMIAADAWRLAFAALVPFSTEVWQLAVLAVGLAIGNATARPAELATVPSVAGPRRLVAALSLVQVTTAVIRIVGPAVGAAIISTLGAGPVFWVQALCYIGSLLALRLLVVPEFNRPVDADAPVGMSMVQTAR